MHIAKVPNRNARPSFLLRETYRENGKVKNRTLANLSKLPIERIDPPLPHADSGQTDRRSDWGDILLDVRRLLFVLGKVLRYGVFPSANRLPVPAYRRDSFAVRLRHCLEDLGLTYLKLGQFLALRFD